jgi:hypothetical protein
LFSSAVVAFLELVGGWVVVESLKKNQTTNQTEITSHIITSD